MWSLNRTGLSVHYRAWRIIATTMDVYDIFTKVMK